VSLKATEWGSPSDVTGKNEVLCQRRCGTIKIIKSLPTQKALSAEYMQKILQPFTGNVDVFI
jgi:hypothetical protein